MLAGVIPTRFKVTRESPTASLLNEVMRMLHRPHKAHADGASYAWSFKRDLAQRASSRIFETHKIQPRDISLLAAVTRPATRVGELLKSFDELTETRGITGRKNYGVKRMLGTVDETYLAGCNLVHSG